MSFTCPNILPLLTNSWLKWLCRAYHTIVQIDGRGNARHHDLVPAKFDTLRAQGRARGDCFKCGGKYGPTHKCMKKVELAVIDNICDALYIKNIW
jgi:hypothetical protein